MLVIGRWKAGKLDGWKGWTCVCVARLSKLQWAEDTWMRDERWGMRDGGYCGGCDGFKHRAYSPHRCELLVSMTGAATVLSIAIGDRKGSKHKHAF